MSDVVKRLEQQTKTSGQIMNLVGTAFRLGNRGNARDIQATLWVPKEVAEAVINDIQQEQNKKLTQIVETLSEPSKFMTEYGKGRLSLACELLGIPKECQPCPILTKCPCNHEFGHCSWKETFKEAELLGKPQV